MGCENPKTIQSWSKRAQHHRGQLLPGKGRSARLLPTEGHPRFLVLYRMAIQTTSAPSSAKITSISCPCNPSSTPECPARSTSAPRGMVQQHDSTVCKETTCQVVSSSLICEPADVLGSSSRAPRPGLVFQGAGPPRLHGLPHGLPRGPPRYDGPCRLHPVPRDHFRVVSLLRLASCDPTW